MVMVHRVTVAIIVKLSFFCIATPQQVIAVVMYLQNLNNMYEITLVSSM